LLPLASILYQPYRLRNTAFSSTRRLCFSITW
jgi:hypothetical protein